MASQRKDKDKGMFNWLGEYAESGLSRLRRLPSRVVPQARESLDQRLDALSEWVDDWNRRLAERAIPPERRERIRERSNNPRSRLKVVTSARGQENSPSNK